MSLCATSSSSAGRFIWTERELVCKISRLGIIADSHSQLLLLPALDLRLPNYLRATEEQIHKLEAAHQQPREALMRSFEELFKESSAIHGYHCAGQVLASVWP